MPRTGKSIRTESRLVVARVWKDGRMRSDCLMGMGLPSGWWTFFGTKSRWQLHKIVTVLNAVELFTLKRFTSYYVNYPSIKNTRKYAIQTFNRKYIYIGPMKQACRLNLRPGMPMCKSGAQAPRDSFVQSWGLGSLFYWEGNGGPRR